MITKNGTSFNNDGDIKRISYIALMQDIGKIGIPDAILNKAGKN